MDIRFPLGLMFAVMGALLSGFGLVTASSPIYRQHSLGVNVNLWAGLGIFFGCWISELIGSLCPTFHPKRSASRLPAIAPVRVRAKVSRCAWSMVNSGYMSR